MYNEGYSTKLTFDLVEGWSPLIVAMDLKQYSYMCNLTERKLITYR